MPVALQSVVHWLKPSDEPADGEPSGLPHGNQPGQFEDLPYKVELWNVAKTRVEQVLAVRIDQPGEAAADHALNR